MNDDAHVFERFVTLAKRDLHAEDVRILDAGEPTPEADNVLVNRLLDGRHVIVTFAEAPKDRDALARRLAILANTFSSALLSRPSDRLRARPPIASSLHEELKALAARSRAVDVVVIDTDSPVVWGSATIATQPRARNEILLRDLSDRELASHASDDESGPLLGVLDLQPPSDSDIPRRDSAPVPAESSARMSGREHDDHAELTRRAVAALRQLPALEGLHKGRHLRHAEQARDHWLAVSFSGIYLLCLVFDGEFDELRAERAASDSLPRIERLVLALPPLDPEPPQPMGGVVALRSRRRR
jgi:hypothetical protein